jgi:hypothetical protein
VTALENSTTTIADSGDSAISNASENPPRIFQGVGGNLRVTGSQNVKENIGDVESSAGARRNINNTFNNTLGKVSK